MAAARGGDKRTIASIHCRGFAAAAAAFVAFFKHRTLHHSSHKGNPIVFAENGSPRSSCRPEERGSDSRTFEPEAVFSFQEAKNQFQC